MLNEIDLSRTDLNLLVVFDAIMRERHVGRAAARLHLTPSAVSHGLARLRRQLGDPLFLKHPKGVAPTARATELAAAVAELLAQARTLLASSTPFDPATSRRAFSIGAPDAITSVILPPLLADLRALAPGIGLGIRDLLPQQAIAALDSRDVDLAVVPLSPVPARFAARALFDDDFVIAARAGHPWLREPTLDAYCRADHLVVSTSGTLHGFYDDLLAASRRTRRVAIAAPNYMLALSLLATSDLLAAVPRRLVEVHGTRFALAHAPSPVPVDVQKVLVVAPTAALGDPAFAWLVAAIERAAASVGAPRAGTRRGVRASSRRPS